MARHDGGLITGLSSASARKSALLDKQRAEKKQAESSKLRPYSELITAWIDEEKARVTNIEKIVLDVENQENLQAQIMALNMHVAFLNSLNTRAQNLLRREARIASELAKEQSNG